MGLHAKVIAQPGQVLIALHGEFREPEFDQLRAILGHFHQRGCRRFVLDLSEIAPMSAAARSTLNGLIGDPTMTAVALPKERRQRRLLNSGKNETTKGDNAFLK